MMSSIVSAAQRRKFSYDSLQGKDSFRLLKVHRLDDGTLKCQLKTFSLASHRCPDFTTFSYVWGEDDFEKGVVVNDQEFWVLRSVLPILEFVSESGKFKKEPWVWIDSICMNLENLEERSSQVRLMNLIYTLSRLTIVWLGPGSDETDEAMTFLKEIGQENRPDTLGSLVGKSGFRYYSKLPPKYQDERKWKLIDMLLDNPWWRRAWTLQEYILPSHVLIHYGRKRISKREMHVAISVIHGFNVPDYLIQKVAKHTPWNRRRLNHWHLHRPNQFSLLALMAHTAECEATDPRDRIYSVLALANEESRQMVGPPTYSMSVEEVFKNLVIQFMTAYCSLDIICFAQIFHQSRNTVGDETKLPSWVPDWRKHAECAVTPLMVCQSTRSHIGNFRPIDEELNPKGKGVMYSAAKRSRPQANFSEDMRRLTCKGFFIDCIDGVGGVDGTMSIYSEDISLIQSTSQVNCIRSMEELDRPEKSKRPETTGAPACTVEDIIRCLVMDRSDRYLTYPALPGEYLSEFWCLVDAKLENLTAPRSRAFVQQYKCFKDLLIQGSTVHSICCTARATKSSNLGPGKTNPGLAYRFLDTLDINISARRLMTTVKGYIGIVPKMARKGDFLCVLYGCSVPVILRRQLDSSGSFNFVGECYLQGFMEGETLDNETYVAKDFTLV